MVVAHEFHCFRLSGISDISAHAVCSSSEQHADRGINVTACDSASKW